MDVQTMQFGDAGQLATRELLKRFEALRPEVSGGTSAAMAKLREELKALDALDRQHGGSAPLPGGDAEALVAATITDLAHLDSDCKREGFNDASFDIVQMAVGVGLWAARHDVALDAAALEHVTNALANLSNSAVSSREIAAVFGLMQGVIAHVKPRLAADPERSNPLRPWRLLNVNLAITAIRTEDASMMQFAFDALDDALPDERARFYAEALAAATAPGIARGVRERIEQRHKRWNLS